MGLSIPRVTVAADRLEGGEYFAAYQCCAASQPPKQRRFTGIGISNDGRVWERETLALFPLRRSSGTNQFQISLHGVDMTPDNSAVSFQLSFTFTSSTDATTLAAQVSPCSSYTRQRIFQSS